MQADTLADARSWGLLLLLSFIWGGSFLFVGIAIAELPPLLIVLSRVALASLILIPIHFWWQGRLPTDSKTWFACFVMSLINNVVPFFAIAWGQQFITSGLASVINATTPIFTVLFLAVAGLGDLGFRKLFALALGLIGVIVLKGGNFGDFGPQSQGIFAVLLAALSYGLSGVWSKKRLTGIPAITTATCQITCSSLVMLILVFLFAEPSKLLLISAKTFGALIMLSAFSTAIAYLIFFNLMAKAGPSFVSLVTMLIPVSAIIMGVIVLRENLDINEIFGAIIIGAALIAIDGRVFDRFKIKV